jgi:hypothetical protein
MFFCLIEILLLSTTRNIEIYDVSRVTVNAGITNLIYL